MAESFGPEIDETDPAAFSDDELGQWLIGEERRRASADARWHRMAGAWERRRAWAADGALSGAAWLVHRTGVGGSHARARVLVARRLRHLSIVSAALDSGEIRPAQAAALARARQDGLEEAMTRDEKMLVDQARRLTDDQFAKVLGYWRRVNDPDQGERDDRKLREDRHLYLSQTFGGAWVIDGVLDPESGAIVKACLEAIDDQLRRADLAAQAAARRDQDDGMEPPADKSFDAPRKVAQRRVDALAEMARRATAAGDSATSRRPLFTVLADADFFSPAEESEATSDDAAEEGTDAGARCQHPDGTPLGRSVAERLACDADFVGAVFGADGELLNLGTLIPRPSAAQRRALVLRDGGCVFPGCDRPAGWCDAHHVIWRERSGPTDLDNLALLCRAHHHLIHDEGFRMAAGPTSGQFAFSRPDGTPIPTRPRDGPLHGPRLRSHASRRNHRARAPTAA